MASLRVDNGHAVSKLQQEIVRPFKQTVRSYDMEARWFFGEQMPTFTEYLSNGLFSSSYYLMSAAALMGMKSAKKETYDWHWDNPKILKAACTMGRLRNDVASCERENKREHNILAIECYMKEQGVSKQEALEKFLEISEKAWIDMNEELLRLDVSRDILVRILNIARMTDSSYMHDIDGYTFPEQALKRQMLRTLVDPIII
ncbi:Alpha-humulene/(-)-(E)-beta-caryophyllene synthase [Forsythia ovata]|uniref:Alpha-humulene/(-)-(E)-beta-caryophyllene synthase n=1 Tax=Forsythia ovata TaxID=205694 RepID=A0ABD1VEM0_9LAMI